VRERGLVVAARLRDEAEVVLGECEVAVFRLGEDVACERKVGLRRCVVAARELDQTDRIVRERGGDAALALCRAFDGEGFSIRRERCIEVAAEAKHAGDVVQVARDVAVGCAAQLAIEREHAAMA
jgi:hypothetical protein